MSAGQRRLLLFNKPYNVLSQFTDRNQAAFPTRRNLSHFLDVPDVRPAGRLDRDSEGLLVLTDDGELQQRITAPDGKMSKTYWVQVEGEITAQALTHLGEGVDLKDGPTLPAKAEQMASPPWLLWPRDPPVRVRRNIPTTWISLTLREGRNRQVRRMCAAVGFPALRLIRYRVGSWTLDGIAPGQWQDGPGQA